MDGQKPEGVPESFRREIAALLDAGRKIEAIKRLRGELNLSLSEAKEFVAAHEAAARGEAPGEATGKKRAGCGATAALFMAGVLLATAAFVSARGALERGWLSGEVPEASAATLAATPSLFNPHHAPDAP